ncbi:MAG: glycosyltransferase family 39 protein [Acidimicrobiia bacterium]
MTPSRRMGGIVTVGIVALIAAVIRFPAFLSPRHLNYDDGVYASSVLLMRHGLDPFRDFFSSQGPVFLPVLRLFDMLGIGGLRSSRLAMVATGALLAVAMYLLARLDHDRPRSLVGGLLAASSGILLISAGPLQSDGLALALGLLALVTALGDLEAQRWRAPSSGVLLALGVATKSLNLLPLAIVVIVVIALHAGRRSIAEFWISGLIVGAAVTLVWDVGAVWEQYVTFHLAKQRSFDLVANTGSLVTELWRGDLPLLILLGAGALLALGARFDITGTRNRRLPTWILSGWLISTVVMIVLITPVSDGFARFAAFLLPPLILVALRTRVPTNLALGFVLIALPFQWALSPVTDVVDPSETEQQIIEVLESTPADSYVVTDQQGLAWTADRMVYPSLVDTSFARIETGSIVVDDVLASANDPRTCAFLARSGRFEAMGLAMVPPGFDRVPVETGTVLAIKPGC